MSTSVFLPAAPSIRVLRGSATDEELAAVTVVLAARLTAREVPSTPLPVSPVARWSRLERLRVLWAPTSWRRAV